MSIEIESEEWSKIAFSYMQIQEFLELAGLPAREATDLFQGCSPQFRCFGPGFYFFINAIKNELRPEFAEELHTLACRVERVCLDGSVENWNRNAAEAERLLRTWS